MNPEVKALWIEALTSGEYAQGQSYLARKGEDGEMSYCCLGVLCDLAVKAGVEVEVGDSGDGEKLMYDGEINMLPTSVTQWANEGGDALRRLNTSASIPGHAAYVFDTLWELNDSAEWTFAQIAKVIEREF